MKALRLLAGPLAMDALKRDGLKPGMFSRLLAASGGPKWLGIAGLDRFLFGEFFRGRETPLYTLGASSGAWRLACLGQQHPLQAYERLEALYIGQRYEGKPTREQISAQVAQVVAGILGESGAGELVDNPIFRSHFLVCRGRHLNRLSSKSLLALGLSLTAGSNLLSRRTLGWHFERCVFGPEGPDSPFRDLKDLPTRDYSLTRDNAAEVLLATGSIPLVLSPVEKITGLPQGHYYDGGITDYHFDLPLTAKPGLTLYPHFYPFASPGWFDKSLRWRRAKGNYANALMLAPSAEFIASLPNGKLPDRDDFKLLDTASRQLAWRRAADMSLKLADELNQLIHNGRWQERLEPL
ncbi:alpha/beta hydrolase [Shewanella cyperi]|uniref:alpha/beta hydrolase n=1 Tax=Shewanella cyperi TaxID=2814292 RepID=UPI001A93EFA9|nr:alpha/beta hydrolase [Shewanella cyperi]QSX41386.1 alpha/beta hydrolase [Shewanella cyperi]